MALTNTLWIPTFHELARIDAIRGNLLTSRILVTSQVPVVNEYILDLYCVMADLLPSAAKHPCSPGAEKSFPGGEETVVRSPLVRSAGSIPPGHPRSRFVSAPESNVYVCTREKILQSIAIMLRKHWKRHFALKIQILKTSSWLEGPHFLWMGL